MPQPLAGEKCKIVELANVARIYVYIPTYICTIHKMGKAN